VTVIQRAALVERLGRLINSRTLTLGDEDRIVTLQLNDLLSGVDHTMRLVLQDYLKPLRANSVRRAVEAVNELIGSDLEDSARIGKLIGFPALDDPAEARGHRILAQVGRLPDSVREDIVRYFGSVPKLLGASQDQLVIVEGVGETRALQLLSFFDRLQSQSHDWEPVLG
jgi:diadenylate cyclase